MHPTLRQTWATLAAHLVLRWRTSRRLKPTGPQLRRMEYCTSTQRLGLRFTETLRHRWRARWLKWHRS